MRIKVKDTTPMSSMLVLTKYTDTLGTVLLTKGWV